MRRGIIGDVQAVTVSNTHEYHAASAIRILLGTDDVPFTVIGKKMDIDLTRMYLEAGRKPFTFIESKKMPWQK